MQSRRVNILLWQASGTNRKMWWCTGQKAASRRAGSLGLSWKRPLPGTENDWAWWKNAWDEQMMDAWEGDWPFMFATWVQNTLQEVEGGDGSAVSNFVHRETVRCFSEEAALLMPGIG